MEHETAALRSVTGRLLRKSALTQLARMDADKRAATVQKWQVGETVSVREITGIKRTSASTPVKLALRALYASVTRLGQIEGELKIDELAALRDVRKKVERAFKTALDGETGSTNFN